MRTLWSGNAVVGHEGPVGSLPYLNQDSSFVEHIPVLVMAIGDKTLQGPLVSVFGCACGARTDRGDAMFAAMVDRSCTAMRDLDTPGLV